MSLIAAFLLVTAFASPPAPAAGDSAERCVALGDLKIDDTNLLSSTVVPAADELPEYCRVLGYVRPAIHFEVRLPTRDWNGRYYQAGCSVYCGKLDTDRTSSYNNLNLGLARGYAAATTDSGHWGTSSADALWAYHDRQAEIDWAYRANHETARVAKRAIEAFYARGPERSYFDGCSDGGRQGIMASWKYPADFDGVLSRAPALSATREAIRGVWLSRVNTGADGARIVTEAELPLIQAAVVRQCDAADGVEDGVIDDPRTCDFDPAVLACGHGSSEECLSPAQVETLRAWYAGPRNSAGESLSPGVPPGSEAFWGELLTGTPETGPGYASAFTVGYLRYLAFPEDPGDRYEMSDFDLDHDPARLAPMGRLYDVMTAELGAFQSRGGRQLVVQGWADALAPPLDTLRYHEAVEEQSGGRGEARDFLRLFMVPGWDHCGRTPGPGGDQHSLDPFAALERWVEDGVAPESILTTKRDDAGEVAWTRPVCAYPARARYTGEGDVNDASSFECVAPEPPRGTPE